MPSGVEHTKAELDHWRERRLIAASMPSGVEHVSLRPNFFGWFSDRRLDAFGR